MIVDWMCPQTVRVNSLVLGDCLDVMEHIAPGSVQAIITDLPYQITQNSWDEIIPFEPMWKCAEKVLSENGVFITTSSQPFTSKLVMSKLDWFRYEWIWEKDKSTGHLDAKKRPMRKHENIPVFSKNGNVYNPQIKRKPLQNIRPVSRRAASDNYGKYKERAERGIPKNMSYPQSVIDINTTNIGERGLHPTQKPVALYKYLIKTYTNIGDTVLDIAMGSATTIESCIDTERNFIGIEINKKYFTTAVKRINKVLQQSRFSNIGNL